VLLGTLSVAGIIATTAGTGCEDAPRTPQGTRAALQESVRLREQLRMLDRTEEREVAQELRRTAELGDADAQYRLGVSYRDGKGVDRDCAQAVAWWRKAAGQGHARAQSALGFMYANGQGISRDYAQAVAWYRRAAEQGVARAQFNLGVMYSRGRGVARDDVEAYKWMSLAAPLEESAAARDRLAQDMTPAQIAEAERRAQEWTAAFKKRNKQGRELETLAPQERGGLPDALIKER
jgi:TPR repeat protein